VDLLDRRLIPGSQHVYRITPQCRRRWHIRKRPAIRTPELEGAVRLPCDFIALLVHGPVVPPTQKREIREGGGPTSSPMSKMMSLPERHATAREAATTVPMLQSPA
jgi:hypothetical protein